MPEHHFNVDFAVRYGILEAVIINHFQFWIKQNEANNRNFHDGRYWTFNSAKAVPHFDLSVGDTDFEELDDDSSVPF